MECVNLMKCTFYMYSDTDFFGYPVEKYWRIYFNGHDFELQIMGLSRESIQYKYIETPNGSSVRYHASHGIFTTETGPWRSRKKIVK